MRGGWSDQHWRLRASIKVRKKWAEEEFVVPEMKKVRRS